MDTGIKDLVDALSAFPQLQTIESCQGDSEHEAWVCFYYGMHPWRDLAKFLLGYLGPRLSREVGDRANVSIQVTESGQVRGELAIRPGATRVVIKALKGLLRACDI